MITCYVIDDEPHAVDILSDLIYQTPGLQLMGSSTNPLIALKEITEDLRPDLTFVDIEMPELSGLSLSEMIRSQTKVVFTTAYEQFALQAFERQAYDYLLKPITKERFLQCINRFRKQSAESPIRTDHFYIKGEAKGKITRVNLPEILFIESALNYITIHLVDGRTLTTYLTLTEIQEFLPQESFSRVHKSFLVSDDKIQSVSGNEIILNNKKTIVIGMSYRENFIEKLNTKILKTKRIL